MRARTVIATLGAVVAASFLAARALLPDLAALPDRAFSVRQPPADQLRIVAFGTSLTARAVWPDRLADTLARCFAGDIEVRRVAKSGVNSDWGLAHVAEVRQALPDLVIIEFAVNDADLADGVWPWRSRANHEAIIAELHDAPGPPGVILVATSPVSGFGQMIKRPFLGRYQAAYASIAMAEGAGFVNATARWTLIGDVASALPDGLHPLPEAEAEIMVPALTGIIARGYGLDCGAETKTP